MKFLLLCCALLGTALAGPVETTVKQIKLDEEQIQGLKILKEKIENYEGNLMDDEVLTAEINEWADKLFTNVDKLMIKKHFDPIVMPEVHEEIDYYISSCYYSLWNGQLTGPATLGRDGHALITYNKTDKQLKFAIPLAFQHLDFEYRWAVKLIWFVGYNGIAGGDVKNLEMRIAVGINFDTFMLSLIEYKVVDSGHITINFSGLPFLWSWWVYAIANASTAALNRIILNMVENMVKEPLGQMITVLNTVIQGILHKLDANDANLLQNLITDTSLLNY